MANIKAYHCTLCSLLAGVPGNCSLMIQIPCSEIILVGTWDYFFFLLGYVSVLWRCKRRGCAVLLIVYLWRIFGCCVWVGGCCRVWWTTYEDVIKWGGGIALLIILFFITTLKKFWVGVHVGLWRLLGLLSRASLISLVQEEEEDKQIIKSNMRRPCSICVGNGY